MHPNSEQLEAFDRGEIGEPDASAIEDHLATCPACQASIVERSNPDLLVRMIRVAYQRDRGRIPPLIPRQIPTGYELLEPLGRGGMGVVFKARQRGLGRLVALKQIRAGLDADPKELARFQTEAKAAALLAHPNIVQVFDVGEQDGLPYIAMELVDGGNLADRLANGPLPPLEAAALVETLARAVQHSHENGIVHRDLKPANILLTTESIPRITDFGLVKLEGAVGPTHTGALLGTPRYMAPEQIDGGSAGFAVDIYALGAILYECLTGRPPFQGVSALDVLDQIRSHEPLAVGRLQSGVPRDLQTICMKCLEKDPRRRYPGAATLSADLGRFLRSEPIEARPISPVERLGKWVRRRPYQAGLAGLAAIALVGAFSGLLVHQSILRAEIGRTARAADDARRQKNLADANYRDARAAIRAILDCHDDPTFAMLPRRSELQRAQAEKALIFYDRLLAADESPYWVVQLDTARAAREAAMTQHSAGRFRDALVSLERSVRLIDGVMHLRPNDPDVIREEIQSRTKLGMFVWHTNKTADRALAEIQRALDQAKLLADADPRSDSARADVAWCLHDLGSVLQENRRNTEALSAYRRAIEINRTLVQEKPDEPRRAAVLAENLNNLGLVAANGDPDSAEAAYREATALLETTIGGNFNHRRMNSLSAILNNWGNLAARSGRAELALNRFDRGLTVVDDVLRREPGDTAFRYMAMNLHGSRANLLGTLKRHADSVHDWDRVIELNDDPADRVALRLLRIMALLRTSDYARGVADAEDLAQTPPGSKPMVGADLYNLACAFGIASSAARADARLKPENRKLAGDAHASAAMRWLKRAAEAGFFDDAEHRDSARRDPDLAAVRNTTEFGKLTAGKSR